MLFDDIYMLEVSAGALGVIIGTFLSGLLMSLYTITMPVLIRTSDKESLLLHQWKYIFDRGHLQGPALAITTSVMYGCAAWLRAVSGRNWAPFISAVGLTMGIVPYTWIFMSQVNNALFAAVGRSSKTTSIVAKHEVQEMIVKWSRLHGIRSVLPLAGAVLGLLAMLQ